MDKVYDEAVTSSSWPGSKREEGERPVKLTFLVTKGPPTRTHFPQFCYLLVAPA